jgi:EAL domain-containing protein (putative c-di-GMP-specific phosphodiesterase class I)
MNMMNHSGITTLQPSQQLNLSLEALASQDLEPDAESSPQASACGLRGLGQLHKEPILYSDEALVAELRQAVVAQQLHLAYQPIVNLGNQKIVGLEALVRWNHPTRGFIPPLEFIPIAERSGLIHPLGQWVLNQACRQLSIWQFRHPQLKLHVNVAPCQFEQPNFSQQVKQAIATSGIFPECLRLEITESTMMQDTQQALITLRSLRQLGVRIHMDDFGIGYSSLSQLYRLPVDALKLDRSLISSMHTQVEQKVIVRMIIKLAWELGLEVIAEGIETEQQLEWLQRLGCDYGQGYYFAKPVLAEQVFSLLAQPICPSNPQSAPESHRPC